MCLQIQDGESVIPRSNRVCGLAAFASIRNTGLFSSRNTSKGALIEELHAVFSAIKKGLPPGELSRAILEGEILRKTSFETRRKIADAISHRYLWNNADWSIWCIADATEGGVQSSTFLSLTYLYYALRDRLTFEFVVGPIWDKWKDRSTVVSQVDFLAFIGGLAAMEPNMQRWRESTRLKLVQSILAALRDFGLLRGIRSKQIQKPAITPETTFHLLCILMAEGREGRSLIEAPDWRLFLWSESEVVQALGDLAQRRWIRFEKSGRTTMLELLRQPGEMP